MVTKKLANTIIWLVILLLGVDFLIIKVFDFLQIYTTDLISPQLILIVICDVIILGIMLEDVIKTLRYKPSEETVIQKTPGFFEVFAMILFGKRPKTTQISQPTPGDQATPVDMPVSDDESSALKENLPKRKETIVAWFYAFVAFVFLLPVSLSLIYYMGSYIYNAIKDDPSHLGKLGYEWFLFPFVLFISGYYCVSFFRITLGQIKNRAIFNRGNANTRAQLLAHWWCKGESGGGSYRSPSPDEHYLKMAFHPAESINYTGTLIVVASVSDGVYQNMKDKELVNIQYARDDPLIIKIEGESP